MLYIICKKCVQNKAEVYFLHQCVVPGDKVNISELIQQKVTGEFGSRLKTLKEKGRKQAGGKEFLQSSKIVQTDWETKYI